MAVISEVKCGRCDRRYSGFRSRCPYCGARRNKRGKHADETENAKAKLVIGILLLVLLIAATMVLILTSLPDPEASNPTDSAAITTDAEPTFTDDENVTAAEDSTEPEPSVTPSESPSPVIEIAEVDIIYNGDVTTDFTLTHIGDKLPLSFKTIPDTTGKTAVWASSDEAVFMVLQDGTVTAIGKGSATLTCTVDGVVGKCIVRVRGT